MEKLALYRKYRPKTFDEVYDQSAITKTLVSAIKSNDLFHSYIFAGNKGSGKTSIAKIFSKAINCLNPSNGNPCNKCENCLSIDNNSSMDFFELDAASNSGVSEIRSLINSINYLPSHLKYKVYVIDEAHMLTTNSWNALLKTIEEPPSYVIFIFATTEYHKIPATIISRCQRYDFHKIKSSCLSSLINDVAKKEDIKISSSSIDIIAKLADGAARDALSILDQLASFSNKKISDEVIYEIFGLVSNHNKINLINYIYEKNIDKIVELINNINESSSINFSLLCYDLIEILMDKIIFLKTNNKSLLKCISSEELQDIKPNDVNYLLNLVNTFTNNVSKVKNSSNVKSMFEYLCFIAIDSENNHLDAPREKQANISLEPKREKEPWTKISQESNINVPELNENTFTTKEDNSFNSNKNTTALNNNIIPTKKITDHDSKKTTRTTKSLNTKTESLNETSIFDELYSTNDDDDDLDIKSSFFSIASNHNSKTKDKFNQILDNLKEFASIYSPTINNFISANRFLITSKNGAILLFDDELEAIKFNKISKTNEFNKFFKESFLEQKMIYGISKEDAKKYRDEYQKLNKKEFKDVKISKDILDTKTKLLNILNDKEFEEE